MNKSAYVLAYDIGTTGAKTCLFRVGDSLEIAGSRHAGYPLFVTDDGGAEQRADDWWDALCKTTRGILADSGLDPALIRGIAFCCQMQGFIGVDKNGAALRNPMTYMDGRSTKQADRYLKAGLLRVEGVEVFRLIKSLRVTGGLAATPKDPLWKYHWMKDNEPELFARLHKWLDVKDYLNMRCTDRATMTPDSAHITFVYDTRPGKLGWNKSLCRLFDVNTSHLPEIVQSTERVGGLTAEAAGQLGLKEGTPVFGGGGDTSCISLGAGCVEPNDAHIYVGTSGWAIANVDKRMVDVFNFVASIFGAIPGRYNYIAEQDTSGICLQWAKNNILMDGLGIYGDGDRSNLDDGRLYAALNEAAAAAEPGCGGVIFAPWLHGNRAPRQDPFARAMFFNVGLNTDKKTLLRSVMEGVAHHKRWILDAIAKRVPLKETIRFVGGGAKSDVWRQIMADVTGRTIESTANPQDAGAAGAAMIAAVGLGLIDGFERAKTLIPASRPFRPNAGDRAVHDQNYEVFKKLYDRNKKLFWTLNAGRGKDGGK